MKINQYIISLMLLVAVSFGLASCNDFLEEKPESMVGPDNIPDSEDGVDLLVTGVYSNWLYDMFCWAEFPRVLELDADYISGPDWLFSYLGAGNFQGESALDKMWKGPYNLINDANLAERILSGFTNVEESYLDNAMGEILFQEAFAYFLLVRAYGPIPYMDSDVTETGKFHGSRRPVEEIYNHIIEMLTQASELMYSHNNPKYKKGHVSAGSAAGLLAKVYATMAAAAMPEGTQINVKTGIPYIVVKDADDKDMNLYLDPQEMTFLKTRVEGYQNMNAQELYAKAAEWAKKVIDGEYGNYQLSAYDNLWSRDHRTDTEMMWGVESNGLDDQYYRTSVHTYYSGIKKSQGSEFIYSGGWVGCTNHWYKLFDEQDYRVSKGVRHFWRYYYQEEYNGCFYYPQSWSVMITGRDPQGNWVQDPEEQYSSKGYIWQYNGSSECLAFTTKYDDVSNDAIEYPDSYWPFLRYADVLLIYAEAENELGNAGEAMKYLNMVRQRSNARVMDTVLPQINMRSLIIEERAKELACEGDRRWDLIRWGIYLDAMNAIGGRDDANINKARTERNLLYPIPVDEINVNDSISTNNPGWN